MGWTAEFLPQTRNSKGKYVYDRKGELDKQITGTSGAKTWKVLKSAMVGSTYYAAVELVNTEKDTREVFAAVVLTRLDNKEHCNFFHKEMDESWLPDNYDCPASILNLLTDTDNKEANEWRNRCRQKIEQKKSPNALNKLPVGAIIEFKRYNAEKGDYETVRAVKRAPAYQFKTDWWQFCGEFHYISKKHIPDDYEVLIRGKA